MNKERINEFLNFFKQLLIDNPNLDLLSKKGNKIIYHELIKLGVSQDDLKDFNKSTDYLFGHWIKNFRDKDGIKVFVDPFWSYFCQFQNGNLYNELNHLKIYIPVDSTHINEAANKIFEFLRENNIKHLSKIASEIRFDDIVVRLINPNDVLKLIDFINNDEFIKEGLIAPNPFAFSKDNIAMVCDGSLSYNNTICSYIGLYLTKRKEENKLDMVNSDDFFMFIKEYYREKFQNKNNIKDCFRDFNFEVDECNDEYLQYLKNITELIINSSGNFNFYDYINHYKKIINIGYVTQEREQIGNALTEQKKKAYEKEDLEVTKMFLEAIKIMSDKYGKKVALESIEEYVKTNNYACITRTNNLRETLYHSQFSRRLKELLQRKNISFYDYVNQIVNTNQKDNSDIDSLLYEYMEIMTQKYGRDIAIYNMQNYLINGNINNITRENDLRNRIIAAMFREKVSEFLQNNSMTIEEYIESIYSKKGTIK